MHYNEVTGTNVTGSRYEEGWYLPSIAEYYQIYVNGKGTDKVFNLDEASNALGGDQFGENQYFTSSQQKDNTNYAVTFHFDTNRYGGAEKIRTDKYACYIHEF